jgi:hypothetical protein
MVGVAVLAGRGGIWTITGHATVVSRVDGDYFAVMGLALNRLVRLLEQLGLSYEFGPLRVEGGRDLPVDAGRTGVDAAPGPPAVWRAPSDE